MEEKKLKNISKLFEGKEIRSVWDEKKEDYYFSVVDVVGILTDSDIPRNYWSDLKRRLKTEGSELHEKIVQLKLLAKDGKMRETDTLDTRGILRLIESIPSPKAEPFKVWLANLGGERIDEVFNPELATLSFLLPVLDRFKLTDIWKEGGIEKSMECTKKRLRNRRFRKEIIWGIST